MTFRFMTIDILTEEESSTAKKRAGSAQMKQHGCNKRQHDPRFAVSVGAH